MTTEKTTDADSASVSTDLLERAAFEAWVSAPPFERNVERCSDLSAWPGSYKDIRTDLAWQAWKESAKAEREACAEVCRQRVNELQVTILTANPHTSEHITLRREARLLEANTCAREILARSNA